MYLDPGKRVRTGLRFADDSFQVLFARELEESRPIAAPRTAATVQLVRRKAFPNAAAFGLPVLEYDDEKACAEFCELTIILFRYRNGIGGLSDDSQTESLRRADRQAGKFTAEVEKQAHSANKKPLLVRFDTETLKRVAQAAKRLNISRSAFVASSTARELERLERMEA